MTSIFRGLIGALASLWLTLACLVAAAAIAVAGRVFEAPIAEPIAAPFAMLCLNLLAALAVSGTLRRQSGLLGFHLALAALAALAAADRLVSLDGRVEVTEGAAFDAALVEADAGPLHPWRLDRVRFVQGGFEIRYGPGMRRRDTDSQVLVPQAGGGWREVVVGDDRPLVAGGYRLYTSFNKGLALRLTYFDAAGAAHSGAIHLPSYPLNHFRQGNDWTLPDGSAAVKLWLSMPRAIYDEAAAWRFRTPDDAVLVVIDDDGRRELRPGGSLAVGHGRLRYDGIGTWMGYTIAYAPLAPWMLAAAAVAVVCLGWHAAGKFRRLSWQSAGQRETADAA